MTEYVIRVRETTDGYHATIREMAPGTILDTRTLPTSATGYGAGSTVPAAILAAVTAARLPELPGGPSELAEPVHVTLHPRHGHGLPQTSREGPYAGYPGLAVAAAVAVSALATRGIQQ